MWTLYLKCLHCVGMPVPAFSPNGYLPPYLGTWPSAGASGVSPFELSISELCSHFGWSAARRQILDGLLSLRATLRNEGLLNGFQWIDGSFCEQIERIEGRDPRDVDVATFFRRPANLRSQAALSAWIASHGPLIDPAQSKATYRCDHYFVDLGSGPADRVVQQACYWHSVFSHRRNNAWKGFVAILPESQAADDAARAQLRATVP